MMPSLAEAASLTLIIAAAGLMRGFSGFGFSMFAVPLMALVMAPSRAVPVVLALTFLSNLQTLRSDWYDIDRRSVLALVLWAVPFAMLGNWVLAILDERPLRLIIGAVTVGATLILWRAGAAPRPRPSGAETAATGMASGILHGLLAMGGPPLTMYYLRGAFTPQAARASMTAAFSLMTLGPLADALLSGRFDGESAALFVILLPTMLIATWIGGRLFHGSPGSHRAVSLPLLAGVGLLAVWSALRS